MSPRKKLGPIVEVDSLNDLPKIHCEQLAVVEWEPKPGASADSPKKHIAIVMEMKLSEVEFACTCHFETEEEVNVLIDALERHRVMTWHSSASAD